MPTEADYLQLSEGDARAHWQSILLRKPAKRQADYTPTEVILCLAASLRVNRHAYGGKNREAIPPPIPQLADLFVRTRDSLMIKMSNLDGGSLSKGGARERAVAAHLLTNLHELATIYRSILSAARVAGISENQLPDFLDLEDNSDDLELLGQRDLDYSAVQSVVEPMLREWLERQSDLDPLLTERFLAATVRVGQSKFARGVLANHGHRCVFCGLTVQVDNRRAARLLSASHIKPWRRSTPNERLDISNGLCACPTHDVAFDTGLITVQADYSIHVNPELEQQVRERPEVAAAFGRPPLAQQLLLPEGAQAPKPSYLKFHREEIFRRKATDGPWRSSLTSPD